MRYCFIQEKVEELITTKYCSTNVQLADVFTKALEYDKFEACTIKLVV